MTEQDDGARLAELTAAIKTNLSRNEELSAERRQVALRAAGRRDHQQVDGGNGWDQ